MKLDLFRPRTVWWPTWKGWLLFVALIVAPVTVWAWRGETFLARTERLPADTLVIESWIQTDGLHAAAEEYRNGGYRYLIVTGGLTGSKGAVRRRSYAEMAERELVAAGIAREIILPAPMPDVENQRTYAMALAVRHGIEGRGLHPTAINVFTSGAHARRSRLVYTRVFDPDVNVGVIAWAPEHAAEVPWWRSSERAINLIKETFGYAYELLFHSGRGL